MRALADTRAVVDMVADMLSAAADKPEQVGTAVDRVVDRAVADTRSLADTAAVGDKSEPDTSARNYISELQAA
jgi:hypothetical protein